MQGRDSHKSVFQNSLYIMYIMVVSYFFGFHGSRLDVEASEFALKRYKSW